MKHSPSDAEALRHSSSQGIKKPLLSFPGTVKPSSVPHAQKPLQTIRGTLPILLSNKGLQEHSMSVQGTLDYFSSNSGSLEHSASSPLVLGPSTSFQSKLGPLSCMVQSEDTLPPVQGTMGFLTFLSGTLRCLHSDQGSQESSLSVSRDLAHLLSTQMCISAQGTLGPLPYTQQSLHH